MAERRVIHETFRIERSYAAAPARVFAAFSTAEARNSWGDSDDPEPPDAEVDNDGELNEFNFRVGGLDRFSTKEQGTTYRYDGRYCDIVTDSRIVYTYQMYADATLISASLATIELTDTRSGTQLVWTEQGAYLDGYNGGEAPAMRKDGTVDMLNGLAAYLQRRTSSF
jgi:uncharacterized protein YndB with AHSA1/START domain